MALRGIQQDGPTSPDELSIAQGTERSQWGLPSDEGQVGQHPGEIPNWFDYAAGILVGHDEEADAQASDPVHQLVRARVDAPAQFQLPHEATHRRYEPPKIAQIAQTAAGFSLVAAPNQGLHYVKVIACLLTLDAAGTIKFTQGAIDGHDVAAGTGLPNDLTGNLGVGGAGSAPFQLPPAELANPWLFTAPDQALGIFTVTGKAQGWVVYAYSPYDA